VNRGGKVVTEVLVKMCQWNQLRGNLIGHLRRGFLHSTLRQGQFQVGRIEAVLINSCVSGYQLQDKWKQW